MRKVLTILFFALLALPSVFANPIPDGRNTKWRPTSQPIVVIGDEEGVTRGPFPIAGVGLSYSALSGRPTQLCLLLDHQAAYRLIDYIIISDETGAICYIRDCLDRINRITVPFNGHYGMWRKFVYYRKGETQEIALEITPDNIYFI